MIFVSGKNLLFGRGVVGVVSSPARPGGGSGTVSVVVFTAWKEDMAGSGRGGRTNSHYEGARVFYGDTERTAKGGEM